MFKCSICNKEIQTEIDKCIYCRMRAELALLASTPLQARRIMQMPDAQIEVTVKSISTTFTAIINSTMATFNEIAETLLRVGEILRQACKEALKNEELAKVAAKYKSEGDLNVYNCKRH